MSRARILADYVSSGDELADKAPLASPAFTGTVAIPNVANLETAVVANTAKVTNSTNASDLATGTLPIARIAADAITGDKLANAINTDIATGVTAGTVAAAALPKTGGTTSGTIYSSRSTTDTGTPSTSYTDARYRLIVSNPQLTNYAEYGIGFAAYGNTVNAAITSKTLYNTEYESHLRFCTRDEGSGGLRTALTLGHDLSAVFVGAISKGSGSFKIDHPLPSKKDTHHLVHSFTESPRADLIYRDKVTLVNGSATVNIDTAAGMSEGTFVLLCDEVQCFTSNESDWDAVKGSVSGNILTIECENSSSTADVAWMVIGERKDDHMMNTGWTDENGKPIIEPLKVEDTEDSSPIP
jgi:hypothetical protein